MDPELLMHHLAQCEERIVKGRVHVDRQRQIVDELVRNGEDSRRSKDLLRLFEDMLTRHIEYREQIVRELGAYSQQEEY